jgi:hypothetical protein
MSNGIPPVRSDVVTVPSAARPTPTPPRVSFGEILAKGASTLVQGAEAAMEMLPGGPLVAAALRGGTASVGNTGPSTPMMSSGLGSHPSGFSNAEGPTSVGGGFGTGTGTGTGGAGGQSGTLDQSLQQSQEMNMYFLQIQQEVNQQNQTFTTLSNVMKSEADTIKNAIGNLR